MTLQKGAMFGLDARIALAIFGALSVISGAALYSAIESAKTEQYRQKLQEFVKAVEHYYLDMGYIPVVGGSSATNIGNLYTNYESLAGWDGPYIGYDSNHITKISINILDDLALDSKWSLGKSRKNNWDADYTEFMPPSCTAEDCHYWIGVYDDSEKVLDLYNLLNDKIDGDVAYNTGKVRLRYPSSSKYSFYYYALPAQ